MKKDKEIFKTFNIKIKESDDDKREITAVGSLEKLDRDGDLVVTDGIDLKFYKKDPIFMWSHRGSETPENILGNGVKVWKDEKKLMFKLNFLDTDINPRADMVYKMYKAGALRAFSIGFQPDWKESEYNEKAGGYKFNKSTLLEISACTIPSNPYSLIQSKEMKQMVKDGEVDDLEVKDFEIYLKELGFEDKKEVEEEKETYTIDALDPESFEKFVKEHPEAITETIKESINKGNKDIKDIDSTDKEMEDVIQEAEELISKDPVDNRDIDTKSEHINTETKCVKCGHDLICPVCDVLVEKEEDLFDWIFEETKSNKEDDLIDEALKEKKDLDNELLSELGFD